MNFWHRYLLRPHSRECELIEEIRATVLQLNSVREWFNSENDADLIEACVYNLESLEARYRYLLKLAKERGIQTGSIGGESEKNRPA